MLKVHELTVTVSMDFSGLEDEVLDSICSPLEDIDLELIYKTKMGEILDRLGMPDRKFEVEAYER